MQYSNIRSRAGLVALVFALIISLVSAVPIPATESGFSSTLSLRSTTLDGQDIQLDTAKIPLGGRMSILPAASGLTHKVRYSLSSYFPGAWLTFTRQNIPTNMDDELVRRSIGSKIKAAFKVCSNLFS